MLLVLAVVPTAVAQGSPETQAIYRLLAAHQFAQAETAARQALVQSPGDCTVSTMLGIALRGEGHVDAALASLRGTLKTCPRFVPALEGAAEIAYQKDLPAARQLLGDLLQVQPANPTAHAMRAAVEARSGDCAAAVLDYGEATALVASSPAALRQEAGCLHVLGRGSEAIPVLEQLLALDDQPANREALAREQLGAGKAEEALTTIQPLLTASPPDGSVMLLAAQITEAENHTPEAIEWLRKAIQADPKDVENYLYFADVSFSHGSFQVGIDFMNLGLKELPGSAPLLLARGVLEVQIGSLNEALADFQEAHRRDPQLSMAEDAMGVLFSQKHEDSAALALFQQKSREQPKDPLLQYLYAEALSEQESGTQDRTEEAILTARRAIALEPGYRPPADLLCVLLVRHGDYQAALQQADALLKQNPYDEVALFQGLQAERRLKRPEKTAEYVKRLEAARAHNQTAVMKYSLKEESSAPAAP